MARQGQYKDNSVNMMRFKLLFKRLFAQLNRLKSLYLPIWWRIHNKIQYKVISLVFMIILLTSAVGSAVILRIQHNDTVSQFTESTLILAASLSDSIERDMLLGERGHIQQSINTVASRGPVNEVSIISNEGNTYVSSNSLAIGQTRDDEIVSQVLTSAEADTVIEERYGRKNLYVLVPILNNPECHACHGSEERIRGVLEIGHSTEPLDDQINRQTIVLLLFLGLTLTIVGMGLALMIRSTVLNPLTKLAAYAGRIADGDLTARINLSRKDEFGLVADTFNEMTERAEAYAQTLQQKSQRLREMVKIRSRLLNSLVSAQEEERRRIARDLHDEIGQSLSVIIMDISNALDDLPSDATETKKSLSSSRSMATQTLKELRKLIDGLRPDVLDQLGLVPAVRSYAKSYLGRHNIKFKLVVEGNKGRLPAHIEVICFRVIQETINNIARHAEADRVNMEISRDDSKIKVTIEDDGKGFDVEKTLQTPGSWGLIGMKERINSAGGELAIKSIIGKGTILVFEIPLVENTDG